ncbi:MAG TPA: hypothetical protein VGF86_07760 [Candidatus Tumulicola sp.]
MLWLIPAAGALAGAICALVGIVAALGASRQLKIHLGGLQAAMAAFGPARAGIAFGRIERDAEATKALFARAARALDEVRAGLAVLRLREASIATKVAWLAFRALMSLR